jgi:hypothetical protein
MKKSAKPQQSIAPRAASTLNSTIMLIAAEDKAKGE